MEYQLNIVHLYPDLLNLYGDKGNIECLQKRLMWRNIGAEVSKCTMADNSIDFENADIIFLGGGSDHEQELVCAQLMEKKGEITDFIENGGTFIALCGGCELLGKYFLTPDKKIEGLGILDITTDSTKTNNRLIGDIIIEHEQLGKIVGFENHSGRMEINSHSPLGRVITGFGNNENGEFEGVIYKNLVGTYLHGPLLPKNPNLCDFILTKALKHKYSDFSALPPLDDTLENLAKNYILDNFSK